MKTYHSKKRSRVLDFIFFPPFIIFLLFLGFWWCHDTSFFGEGNWLNGLVPFVTFYPAGVVTDFLLNGGNENDG